MHILKVGWELNSDFTAAQPYFQYQEKLDNQLQSKKFFLIPGQDLSFEITNEKYCIGYEAESRQIKRCPNHNQISKGIRCETCEELDYYSCIKTCQGNYCNPKTLRAKAICDLNETYLYLTYLGDSFKVGVSLHPLRRWIDQGSFFGMSIAKGNGLFIRYYEQKISKELSIPSVIRSQDKLKSLGNRVMSYAKIKKEFLELHEKILTRNIIKRSHYNIKNPVVIDLRKYYRNVLSINRNPLIEKNYLKGSIIGMIGKILVLKDQDSYYATDLKSIIGKILVPSSKIVRQRTLFDF